MLHALLRRLTFSKAAAPQLIVIKAHWQKALESRALTQARLCQRSGKGPEAMLQLRTAAFLSRGATHGNAAQLADMVRVSTGQRELLEPFVGHRPDPSNWQ